MAKTKIIKQSGAIPYLERDGQLLTVLVTSGKNSSFWLFPKGHLEDKLTSAEAAAAEAYEEAGIRGQIAKKALGSYSFVKLGREYRVKLYPLKVKKVFKKWPEANRRSRAMVSFEEAIKRLEAPEMKLLAQKLYARLKPEAKDDAS